ncbi:hypothetical protein CPB83DRAFT_906974 [Crepidotus variabilis]|uniref:Uncharacterized protein n=1 Tax=Crepidotus variabilis TaxID=179855 RepID=A0A9P6EGC9_9AGAR|nr:hypothetical protein CPB83DRAFT_906974 [Crepidotus variabilis]
MGAYSLKSTIKLYPIMANSLTSLTLWLNYLLTREESGTVLGESLVSLIHLRQLSLRMDEQIDGCETSHEAHQQLEETLAFLEFALKPMASLDALSLSLSFMISRNFSDVFASWFRSASGWERLAKNIPVTLFKALQSFSFDVVLHDLSPYEYKDEIKKNTAQAIAEIFNDTTQMLGEGFQTTVKFSRDWTWDDI